MAAPDLAHPMSSQFRREYKPSVPSLPSSATTTASTATAPTSHASSSAAAAAAAASDIDAQPAIIVDRTANVTYMRGKFLGKGGFAKCYELTNMDTRQVFAGKIVSKATLLKHRAKEKLATEIKIHRSLHHANIVNFHSFFEDKDNVYIVLELCTNKSLMELVRRRKTLTEAEVRYFMLQIVDACEYMHKNSVIHRDLKLGNLFLNENLEIKVGDFGLATTITFDGERKKTLCGTPNYIAPEILEGTNGHSFEVDVWSIGCVLYTMLIGRPPFETSNIKTTYRKIKLNDYKIPHTAILSEEAISLIRATLEKEPSARLSLSAMRHHPFLAQGFVPAALPVTILTVAPLFEGAKKATRQPLRSINADTNEPMPAIKPAVAALRLDSVKPSVEPLLLADMKPVSAAMDVHEAKHEVKETRVAAAAAAREEPRDSLSCSHRYLTDLLSRQAKAMPSVPPTPIATPDAGGLWISKWVDYSNKYGLGYQLSDGSVGVLFNDGTKMVLAPDDVHIQSIERDAHGPVSIVMTVDSFPEAMTKKVTLLKYFRSYMLEHLLNGAEQAPAAAAAAAAAVRPTGNLVHVKKWLRTKHAIVFRLSNGVIQINFFDHTKLVVNVPAFTTTFIDKDRKSNSYFLETLATTNHSSTADLISRLSYATDVVEHLINMGRQRQGGAAAASLKGGLA